jgi:hypothetical protein
VAPARLRGTPFVDVGDLHAWGNRLGAPKATEKQRLLDAMDEQLAALNVNPDDANEIKRSHVRFIAFDFYTLYSRGGPGCLNRFSASISGASARVRLPSGVAAG